MATPNTHFGHNGIKTMLDGCKSIYFVGIGGINMSSLALISLERGYRVGGSDRCESEITKRLVSSGIDVVYDHKKENIADYDAVVYTVAISPDNPEYLEAVRRGIPLISRADYMGYLMMNYKRRIGISGMHGKSTCTSMCAQVLIDGDADPTVLSGAQMKHMGGAYRIGGKDNFVFEACEYMDSFLDFNPNVAVLLNIELDHVDYFPSIEAVRHSFASFADIVGEDGYILANTDDENVREVIRARREHIVTFSRNDPAADFFADNIRLTRGRASFDIKRRGEYLCSVALRCPGEHNIYNSLAAAAASCICGVSPEKIGEGLSSFVGAERRMEYKGSLHGADVYDDYAHHPTEVRSTLNSAAQMGYDRVVCVFQSHTYTRTAKLIDEFASAFEGADEVIVADIYPARETDTLGMSAKHIASVIGEKAHTVGGFGDISSYLNKTLSQGELAIIMGAGDIFKVFDGLDFD